LWALASNRFFSATVRVQRERGHTIVTGGPYRYMRHPGYTGSIVLNLAAPLLLGSAVGLIPAALTVCLIVLRTALEDRMLREELEGYESFACRVRFRLLPGIW
jgi:protein-S-isoprenylcysteine O-methyltransferase Ste14